MNRIENLTQNEIVDLIFEEVICGCSLLATTIKPTDHNAKYDVSNDVFMKAVTNIENRGDYDFSSYEDYYDADAMWYDNARGDVFAKIDEYLNENWKSEIAQQLYDRFKNFEGCTATEDILTTMIGYNVKCYDQYISDGCDDEYDRYVLCSAFQIAEIGLIIRFYYGDSTMEIGHIELTFE